MVQEIVLKAAFKRRRGTIISRVRQLKHLVFVFSVLIFNILLNPYYLFQYWQTSWLVLDKFGMLIISEVAQSTHANFKVVLDTFLQTEHLHSAKKAQVRACSAVLLFCKRFHLCAAFALISVFRSRKSNSRTTHS